MERCFICEVPLKGGSGTFRKYKEHVNANPHKKKLRRLQELANNHSAPEAPQGAEAQGAEEAEDDKEFEDAAEALDAETEDAVAEVQGANPPALAPVHTEAQKEEAAAAEEVQVPVPAPATNANPPVEEAEDAAVQCVTVPAPATNGAEGGAANSEEDPFTLRGNNQAERIKEGAADLRATLRGAAMAHKRLRMAAP